MEGGRKRRGGREGGREEGREGGREGGRERGRGGRAETVDIIILKIFWNSLGSTI